MSDPLSSTSLCPGYKQVEEFDPDDDYEEEEIVYVTVELANVDPTLISSSDNMRLIGLDTPTPFMQLSGTIMKGEHDVLIGTELLLTDNKDDNDRSKRHLTYVGSTSQRLRFKEVQLRSKSEMVEDPKPKSPEKGKSKPTSEGPPAKKKRVRKPKNVAAEGEESNAKKGRKSRKKKGDDAEAQAAVEDEGNNDGDEEAPVRRSKRASVATAKRKRLYDDGEDNEDDEDD